MLDKLLNTSPQYGIVAPQSNVIPENPVVFEEGTMTGGRLDWTIAENPVLPNLAGTLADALIVWGELDEKRQAMKVAQSEEDLNHRWAIVAAQKEKTEADEYQRRKFRQFEQNERPKIEGYDIPFEEPSKVSMAAMEDPINTHIIKKGDTLYSIAKSRGMSVKDLLAANPQIKDPNNIQIGQEINFGFSEPIDQGINFGLSEPSSTKATFEGMKEWISPYEGYRLLAYTDDRGFKTIAIGHNMDRGDSKKVFAEILPDVNWQDVYDGRVKLTDEQAEKLYRHDLKSHRRRAIEMFPDMESYPANVQYMLTDGVFQGFFLDSHNTVDAIRKGDWCRAARNVLKGSSPRGYREDYDRYLTAKEKGIAEGKDPSDSYWSTVARYEQRQAILQEMCDASRKGRR